MVFSRFMRWGLWLCFRGGILVPSEMPSELWVRYLIQNSPFSLSLYIYISTGSHLDNSSAVMSTTTTTTTTTITIPEPSSPTVLINANGSQTDLPVSSLYLDTTAPLSVARVPLEEDSVGAKSPTHVPAEQQSDFDSDDELASQPPALTTCVWFYHFYSISKAFISLLHSIIPIYSAQKGEDSDEELESRPQAVDAPLERSVSSVPLFPSLCPNVSFLTPAHTHTHTYIHTRTLSPSIYNQAGCIPWRKSASMTTCPVLPLALNSRCQLYRLPPLPPLVLLLPPPHRLPFLNHKLVQSLPFPQPRLPCLPPGRLPPHRPPPLLLQVAHQAMPLHIMRLLSHALAEWALSFLV